MGRSVKMNLVKKIVGERRRDAVRDEAERPASGLMEAIRDRRHRSLAGKLRSARKPCIIAEMKKASPSAGLLSGTYDPEEIARVYASNGAAAISVLTEPRHFLGRLEHIRAVRDAVDLPILRKDFIGHPYQVYESAAGGADVILLIVRALDAVLLKDLYQLARSLGLEILIESHSERDLEKAVEFEEALFGINNRDLETLKTDLDVGRRLAKSLPPGRPAVIESGLKTRQDVDMFWSLGYRGFLIGEALMRSERPGLQLDTLTGAASDEGSQRDPT